MQMAQKILRHFYDHVRVKMGFSTVSTSDIAGAARLYRAASVWTAGLGRGSFCKRLANGIFFGQRADLPANKGDTCG